MHIIKVICLLSSVWTVSSWSIDIFSDDVKEKCEKAREEFLTPTDRIMRNWQMDSVKEIVFEADMVLSSSQKARWTKKGYLTENTSPLITEPWPSNTIVYYFTDPSPDKSMVLQAMELWSTKTCMKFHEGTVHALEIFKGRGCYATVGYHSGQMQLSLADICDKRTAVHLLGHVIGLVHQHSRPDRDEHLHIQFHNTALEDVLFLNYRDFDRCPYDHGSAMHFDAYGLSYNGESVFLGRSNATDEDGMLFTSAIGSRWASPSDSDAALVNREYGCPPKPCSAARPPPAACNADVTAKTRHFERTVTFQSMMPARDAAISCIWKTEVPQAVRCSRAAIAITLAERPSVELKRVWFASGCRLFHVEIYDPDADMSYFYCAAQFARKSTKVFVSTGRRIYGIARLYPADWEGFQTAALTTGKVKFFNVKDFVCAGEINGKCF